MTSIAYNGKSYDHDKLKQLFGELEFDSLGKRLFGNSFSSSAARTNTAKKKREAEIQASLFDEETEETNLQTVLQDYVIVRTAEQRVELLSMLSSCSEFCFDTETTGRDPREATPLGIAFAIQPKQAYYVVCSTEADSFQTVLEQFRPLFENESIAKIGHNLKYDITLLKWHGVEVRGKLFDTMLAHMMKEPEMEHGLNYLSKLYLNYNTIKIEELIGPKGNDQRNMADVAVDMVGPYACEDADITLQIAGVMRPDLVTQGVERVCYEVEFPLTNVLVDMEFEGIRLDYTALEKFSVQLDSEIEQLQAKIYEAAGHRFNIDSPKQLGVVLYEELQVEGKPKKTATGQYSTREAELDRLSSRHPIIADILDYRNATKLKRTYVDQLPSYINAKTGRLHTVYSQAWTATGRMQSINPNLQTIPIRKERGREIRAAFVPRDENYLILSADYSQIELRVMAELSGDEAMLEAFQKNIDIHAVTAGKVFGVPVGLVTREMRAKAKMVNFGIIYGISAFGLQQRLNIPKSEASELINNYFAEYPKVREYIDRTIQFARDNGFVQTQTGRKRYLRDINSRSRGAAAAAERLAMNSPIQGTAADILKLAMIKVHSALASGAFKTKMLLTVHDEIVFDLHKSEIDSAIPLIREAMSSAFPMQVPLDVETGYGENWLVAH
ncbi:MAG: DNA polymerase I [Pirellulales bacterium]